MTGLIWLDDAMPFPDPQLALPEGLLAAGGDLSVERLTDAYSMGIFPWFNVGDPVLWWSPDPRMVLACSDFKVSHSLGKTLRKIARGEASGNARVRVLTDTAFSSVIGSCAAPRLHEKQTWISPAIQSAYLAWHQAGVAHSIETWVDGKLVGGLYGVCMGRFFFGESMFSSVNDASKVALAYLVTFLRVRGIGHIDCQQQTSHLGSLGARPISRSAFLLLLQDALAKPKVTWVPGQIMHTGVLAPIEEHQP